MPTKKETKKDRIADVLMLTKIATFVMLGVCVVADLAGYYICKFIWNVMMVNWTDFNIISDEAIAFPLLIAIYYICTLFAYVILVSVLKLLNNLKKGDVFIKGNTGLMKAMALGCIGIFVMCFLGILIWPPLMFIGVVGIFMALIVICVKLVIDKAIDMREELDYTV